MNIKIAVHPLSWTNEVIKEFGGDTPVETYLADAKTAGYQGVETGYKLPKVANELQPLLAQYDLTLVTGWHSGMLAQRSVQEELAAVKQHATLLQKMGCACMSYGEVGKMKEDALNIPMSQRVTIFDLDINSYTNKINEFTKILKDKFNLDLAYHHHLMLAVETPDEIKMFVESTNEDVGLLFDTGHNAVGGGDMQEFINNHSARIRHIHLKDIRQDVLKNVRENDLSFNDAVRKGIFTVPGDGDLDFQPVFDFVNDANYNKWLTVEAEQDPRQHPPLATVTRARKFIKEKFGI